MQNLRNNKAFRTLCWQVFNALVAYLLSSLGGLEGDLQLLAVGLGMPMLNIVTKWINTNVFGDVGVSAPKKES